MQQKQIYKNYQSGLCKRFSKKPSITKEVDQWYNSARKISNVVPKSEINYFTDNNAIPIRNRVFDKIKEAGSLTDVELYKSLTKDDTPLAEDRFNKILLDLEILCLIKVSWITKDEKRIEVFVVKEEKDAVDEENKRVMEKDYEASFPGFDK